MTDTFATTRRAVAAASAISPRLGGRAALAAFFSTAGRMPVRSADEATHDSARRGAVRVRGHELVTYRWGGGDDTVLLLHGWRGRASQFGPLVRELVSEGLHVVSFDAPAHGDSPGRRTDLRDWVAATVQLQAAHGRFRAIVGHSFGGLAALTAARQGVTTASVAAIASAGSPAAFLSEFSDAMRLDEPTRRHFEADFRHRIGEDEASLIRRYDATADPLPADLELLLAHDDTDRQVSPTWSLALLESHRDRARLVRTTGLGHVRLLACDPVLDAVVGLVTGGLYGVDRATAATRTHAVEIAPREAAARETASREPALEEAAHPDSELDVPAPSGTIGR
ncbi:alpha/beta hydrolase [Microbacterium pumilum]|uniref:AB hydrolase-1 domain-containing protein n=1 Tax=Microbacterium pumilum TaxID=344165 RepID=A0ABP5DCB9_9MICO